MNAGSQRSCTRRHAAAATLGAALVALVAGCQTAPGPATLSRLSLERVSVGQNLADEPCWAESVTMAHESLSLEPRPLRAYNIYCGDWEWPSARVFQVPQGTPDLEHWSVDPSWSGFLDRRMTCADLAGTPTTILDGVDARLLSCTLHNGGWPYAALVSFVNGYDYLADGIEAAVPAIECTIALTAGIAADACDASPSAAVALMQDSLRDRMHGAKDLQAYYDAMTLGQHYNGVKAFAKGERQYREALSVQERVLGADNVDASDALMHLALELSNQQQFDSADQLFRNAREKVEGGLAREQQARLESYQALHAANQTRFEEARSGAQRATQLRREQRGALEIPARVDTQGSSLVTANVAYPIEAAQSLYIEAAMDARLGAMAEADRTLEQAERLIATSADVPPLWEPQLLTLDGLIDESLGRAPQAEDAWTRAAREFAQRAPGGRPGDLALLDLARTKIGQGRSDEALALYRTALEQARARNDGFSIAQLEPYFTLMLAQANAGPEERQALNREMFAAAQLVRGGVTATDIARTTLRFAQDDTTTGEVLRRFQQADRVRARTQQAYQAELGRVLEPDHPERRAALRTELDRIDRELRGLEEELQAFQPGYKQILGFAIDADDVMDVLRPDEALLQVLAGEGTLVFLLRNGQITVYQAPVGSAEIVHQVNGLRRELGSRGVAVEGAAEAPARPATSAPQEAHALYARLFDPIASELETVSHLVVAASGPLLSFPFGLLVTEAPVADGSAPIAWLARRTTISVVPSAQSFVYLRALEPSPAAKSLVAFADFIPGTQPDTAEGEIVSVSAYCAARQREQHAHLSLLPNTGLEAQAVARNFAADAVDLHLGGDFTESALGSLPLRDYGVIYLATHGARAGEVACMTEPALVTSAPAGNVVAADGNAEDGYLSSGEVAALELNADLVVLSACNSGDADTTGGESLSGLARAFFFAGARALLVSHWYVDDPATYELMARMFEALHRDPGVSLAEALRAAQIWMMDESPQRDLWNSPYYWAAFTLVGDGARGLGSS